MKAYLSRRYTFSASHRLYAKAYSEAENREVYGKCANPHGHGHNYIVEVTVSGQIDPATGMVCNLRDLDGCVQRAVIDRFDHMNLNLDEHFATEVPTTENFCLVIHTLLLEHFSHATVERVRIEETGNNSFEYAGKGNHGTSVSGS